MHDCNDRGWQRTKALTSVYDNNLVEQLPTKACYELKTILTYTCILVILSGVLSILWFHREPNTARTLNLKLARTPYCNLS
jgi:hypothetical protein